MWIISLKYKIQKSYLLLEGSSPTVLKILQIYNIIKIFKIKNNSFKFHENILLIYTK